VPVHKRLFSRWERLRVAQVDGAFGDDMGVERRFSRAGIAVTVTKVQRSLIRRLAGQPRRIGASGRMVKLA
jgi:hypothetical protein